MPARKKVSFEKQLQDLETTVNNLENGEIPLDDALKQFKQGVKLSNQLQNTLTKAEKTLTKVMKDDGQTVAYDRDKNGQDTNNQVDAKASDQDA